MGDVARRLEELLHEKSKELECEILALEIMEDHVHLFICCPPTIAPDQIMFRLKGYTSLTFPDIFNAKQRKTI